MQGFSSFFLSNDEKYRVNLPTATNSMYTLIPYTHFSVYQNVNRKLALYSACNIADKVPGIPRRSFRKDIDHLKRDQQLGDEFYKSVTIDHPTRKNANVFDRGHIVSKQYPQWGASEAIAKKAADDTFFYPNASPQVPEVNQMDWKDLEEFIVDELEIKKVSVLSGLVLSNNDPVATYIDSITGETAQIQIALKFWKIVYYIFENQLKRIAFVFKQDKIVNSFPFITQIEAIADVPDPFDALEDDLKTYIVDPSLIEKATTLKFTPATNYFDENPDLKGISTDFKPKIAVFKRENLKNYL
tara:strand:- start:830 stop:1729 length:900 start_codon:yes stop_codon:yes gene_type:complete